MKSRSITFLLLLLVVLSLQGHAQAEYRIDGKPTLKVSGTSTLHDWDMVSDQATGSARLTVSGSAVQAINSASLSMPAESIKSGKRQMDGNAYKALSTDRHKDVKFQLTEAKKQGNKWLISGTLELAGVKKPVTFDSNVNVAGSKVTIQSSTSFKLTAFGIDPPTAMLGTIKTGDDVTLSIEMTLSAIN
ncbi:MAG: YceI family protein [Lunatimonas sp.]|uniref:YceI family protein n=1 Tax=Lunatimonas sp. TaxID=2060141 RepID=UPI00263A71B5|nr:YceI family protein [Lunatimonas sp.]MCC5938183.1 YceI family protein [Lunatimonas sp.]